MRRGNDANANSILIFFRARAVRDTVITRSVRYIDVLMTRAIKNSETRIMRNRVVQREQVHALRGLDSDAKYRITCSQNYTSAAIA